MPADMKGMSRYEKIQQLAAHGATEGEKLAAENALAWIDAKAAAKMKIVNAYADTIRFTSVDVTL
jgi:hypothetical protein